MPKVIWISNLRVFATLTVIMLHCAAGGIYLMGKIPDSFCRTGFCDVVGLFIIRKIQKS
ncbi:MAG: hypothetical protein MUF45_10370 [Spirosomaceae bacterium]|nr:hypothetical protein [Spirosomataceae bacterium]